MCKKNIAVFPKSIQQVSFFYCFAFVAVSWNYIFYKLLCFFVCFLVCLFVWAIQNQILVVQAKSYQGGKENAIQVKTRLGLVPQV